MHAVIITTERLEMEQLKTKIPPHPCCGALLQFEGVVRNHHEGKNVAAITYECFEAMAKKELEKDC